MHTPGLSDKMGQLIGRKSAGGNDVLLDLIRDCSCPVSGQFTGHPLSG